MKNYLQVAALYLLASVISVTAHNCPESPITLTVGQIGTVRITADVAESQASHYNLSINSNPGIAVVSPDNFDAFGYGEFKIRAVSPGTNDIVLEWSYAPTSGSGFCVVRVIVIAPHTD